MRLWLIPANYVAASISCALSLPRFEYAYLNNFTISFSITSTQAYLSAVASGMMALTTIVFAVAFVVVQFSTVAYSPRIVLWFVRDHKLFHTLGIFIATFIVALGTLAWIDRGGSETVPTLSVLLVSVLVIVSALLFANLVDRLNDLQINNVLHSIGDGGRNVIQTMYRPLVVRPFARPAIDLCNSGQGTPHTQSQVLKYFGAPRTITKFDVDDLVEQARLVQGFIVIVCAVGDTLVEGETILEVQGASARLPEKELLKAIHLARERTFEQDPKYPIRLLVDIAIKSLSPAINDPTTAVQTIDQIEDLLRRLGNSELDVSHIHDANGSLRVVFPVPTWEDYLSLAFDEIRQYGTNSVQVMRRLRSALASVAESLSDEHRIREIQRYFENLDLSIDRSSLGREDREQARQEDRQGIGLSRGTSKRRRSAGQLVGSTN